MEIGGRRTEKGKHPHAKALRLKTGGWRTDDEGQNKGMNGGVAPVK